MGDTPGPEAGKGEVERVIDAMSESHTYTIHGMPVSLNNAYTNARKGRRKTPEARDWQRNVYASMMCADMRRTRLKLTLVDIEYHWHIPGSADDDNMVKLVRDAVAIFFRIKDTSAVFRRSLHETYNTKRADAYVELIIKEYEE